MTALGFPRRLAVKRDAGFSGLIPVANLWPMRFKGDCRGALAGQASYRASDCKLDRVDYAAFACAVRTADCEVLTLKV